MIRKLATVTALLVAGALLPAAPALADPISPSPTHVPRTWHPTRPARIIYTWAPPAQPWPAASRTTPARWHRGTR